METPPALTLPESLNLADYLLDARVREGKGGDVALRTDRGELTFREAQEMANRFGNLLASAGVEPEQRVMLALHDGPEYVSALFGALKIGAVVVMVNPHLHADALAALLDYTRAKVALVDASVMDEFSAAASASRYPQEIVVVGDADFPAFLAAQSPELETFPTHRDDAAIWLFSGGTTGRPKAVVQTHGGYANAAHRYGQGVIGYTASDVAIGVPKLFFGYAMGAVLFFPWLVGGSAVLFPERTTPETLFEKIERFRPTVLVNVPTMVQQMVSHPDAAEYDLSSLRLATSAGEALPLELYERWKETFGVELLDGLGTAEMWHIFLSNHPGRVVPGTLGTPVAGYEVKVCDDSGAEVPVGEAGILWVKGDSRALGYWQNMEQTKRAFRGEWYVSEDMLRRNEDGTFTYCGRADDMLKVSGKWLAPGEVENCLLEHPAVTEAAVVGVASEADGLVRPWAYVVARGDASPELAEELKTLVRERLATYKAPREVVFLDELPRTHLGKVDRGRLRAAPAAGGK